MLNDISNTYEIIGKIGAGNSGEIYKAYHKKLGKYVVLKKLKTEIKDIVNKRAEVDVLKNLRHSCLPQVLDFLEVDGNVYTVMDYIPGNSFKQYLDAGRSFPERSVMIWTKQICATLCYLHGQKPPIIHSDLKPGNIMLMPDGNICLIDFNISASLDGASAWVTGYTNGYAPPEQIQALRYNQNELNPNLWKTIDARADIYSLGATIYHLMTGEKPLPDEDGYIADIRQKCEKINDVFGAVIMKCLEADPRRRYQSAQELLADLNNMPKKSKQYKGLLVKQRITYAAVIVCAFICAGVAMLGYFRMGMEKQKEYESYVRLQKLCIEDEDFEQFEAYYQKAVKLYPDKLDAYYQKALALNNQRQYGDCIEYISSEIFLNPDISTSDEALNNVYYLMADSYENMQDYDNAALYYEKLLEIKPDNSDYYRDYAITLAYGGKLTDARQVLTKAKEQGMDSVEVGYVEGEIAYNSNQFSDAKRIFLDCIEQSEDPYIQMRAYIMAVKCMDGEDKGADSDYEKIELLEKARNTLPKENNIGILEELAQVYCDLGGELNDGGYYEKAIEVFNQIEEQGMGSYDTDYNLAVLYQNINDYSMAMEILNRMLENYGENYKTYKSLAFLEVSHQSQMASELKNYQQFDEYYHKADERYQEQLSNNVNDVEMDRLEELHTQAVDNGWVSS